jgi:hypothetical protein
MDVAFYFTRPFKKAPKIAALPPYELPKLQEPDLLHLDSAVGFHPPQKIGAAPRGEPVSTGRVPEKSKHVAHRSSEYSPDSSVKTVCGWIFKKTSY